MKRGGSPPGIGVGRKAPISADIVIRRDTLLLVEGRTPEALFEYMVERTGRSDHIQVLDFGGKDDLRKFL